MTITDLKKYSERMNEWMLPTDRMQLTLTRQAISVIGAFLTDRKAALEKALSDPKIKATKKANREMELLMVNDAMQCIAKAEKI